MSGRVLPWKIGSADKFPLFIFFKMPKLTFFSSNKVLESFHRKSRALQRLFHLCLPAQASILQLFLNLSQGELEPTCRLLRFPWLVLRSVCLIFNAQVTETSPSLLANGAHSHNFHRGHFVWGHTPNFNC